MPSINDIGVLWLDVIIYYAWYLILILVDNLHYLLAQLLFFILDKVVVLIYSAQL